MEEGLRDKRMAGDRMSGRQAGAGPDGESLLRWSPAAQQPQVSSSRKCARVVVDWVLAIDQIHAPLTKRHALWPRSSRSNEENESRDGN